MTDYEPLVLRCGTPGYIAPEVLNHKSYDSKCDIFAIGCIIYYLLVGDHLFYNKSDIKMSLLRNSRCETDEILESKLHSFSEDCRNLIKQLLLKESTERPLAE